jgi:hypothetical protein
VARQRRGPRSSVCPTVPAIVAALGASGTDWARNTLDALRKRSPLMLHVTLEQVRRARGMGLADDLRMERDLVRRTASICVPGRRQRNRGRHPGAGHRQGPQPRGTPPRIEDVTPDQVAAFFVSPGQRMRIRCAKVLR